MKAESTRDKLNPPEDKIKFILELYNSNKFVEANKQIDKQLVQYPNSSILYNILGAILAEQNKLKEALDKYNKSVKINPSYAQAYNNQGTCLHKLGKINEAIQSYKNAIKIKPDYADANNNLGTALKEIGENKKSFYYYQKAIEIQPEHADAHNNLGVAYKEKKEFKKSIYHYEKTIQIKPNSPIAYSNLGNVYKSLGDHKKAISCHQKAIQINPKYADAYNNLGNAFQHSNDIEKAVECFEKAIQINSNFAEAQHNLGLLLLLKSNLQEGFKKYEWRRKIPLNNFYQKNAPKTTKEWNGEDLTNKTILIISEQGLGDIIQFSRYLYILKEKFSTNIIFKTHKKMAHLFINNDFKVITDNDPIPNHHYYKFLMSLPQIFYNETKIIPKQINYIPKNEKIFLKWKDKLGNIEGIKIGINWQGNTSYKNDYLRSIPLNFFEILFTIKKINFINLQKGPGIEQIKNFHYRDKFYNFTSEVDNGQNAFEDTIGIINNIDLVISPDTALAHLSATLGTKTWLMLPFIPDWRYFLKIDYSPWYEHMKIYRSEKSNNWEKVFKKVKEDLVGKFNV